MTNLDKLKEVFPDDWNKFTATVGWMTEEYCQPTTTIEDAFAYYFDDTEAVSAKNSLWDKEYKL